MRKLLPPFAFALGLPFAAGLRAGPSPAVSPLGSSTTNRYLHFGQSILRRRRLEPGMGITAPRGGHWPLRLVWGPTGNPRSGVGGRRGGGGGERGDGKIFFIETRRPP